ncbi:MAG: hypothetical protein AAFY22_15150, partial [Pseudomonadota bacterium]
MRKSIFSFVAAAAVMSGAASATTVVETFDALGLGEGDAVNTFSFGTVSTVANAPGEDQAIIFDTNDDTNGDGDLRGLFTRVTGVDGSGDLILGENNVDLGNVLIISEGAASSPAPDDNRNGGVITLTFNEAVTFIGFDAIDTGEDALTVTLLGADGMELGSIVADLDLDQNDNVGTDGDPLTQNFFASFIAAGGGIAGVVTAVFDFGTNSGAIDNIVFQTAEIPVPGAIPLLISGIAGLRLA